MTAVSPTPTRQAILDKLTELEQKAEDVGWGMPPFIAALVITPDGELETTMIDNTLPEPAHGFVIHLGKQMNQDLENTKQVLATLPGFWGLMFGCEGSLKRLRAGHEPLEQIRLIMAADLEARLFQVSRMPSEDIVVEQLDDTSKPELYQHELHRALLQCTRALSVWVADGGKALATLDNKLAET